jgi:hypothetical protein
MRKLAILGLLLSAAACQPLNEGAGGARINAACIMGDAKLTSVPGHAAAEACVVIVTTGATTNAPTATTTPTTTLTIPVSAVPSIP